MSGMTSKGLDWDQARGALPEIARAATASRSKLADMEAVAATLIAQFKFDPGKLADPFNRLAAAANAGGFELRDMAQFLPEVGAAMAKLDTGERAINNLGAGLQVIRKRAGSAGQAATQFTDLLEKMVSPTVVGALDKKFGVDLPKAMAEWKTAGLDPLQEFVGLMQRITDGDAFKIAEVFGDKEARAGIVALMGNWAEFESIRAKAASAPGQDLIGQMFGTRLANDPTLRLLQMSIAVQALSDQIGSSLTPVVIDLVDWIQQIVTSVGTWIENNRELAGTIALWVGGLGAAMVVFGPVAMGIGAIVFAISMVATPIGLAVAAIAALIVALTNWEATVALASQAWDWLLDKIRVDPTPEAVARWAALSTYLRLWADNIPQIFVNAIKAMKNVGGRMIDGMLDGMKNAFGGVSAWLHEKTSGLVGTANAAVDAHSPSRKFMRVGANMMRGLELGIRASERLPMAAMRSAAGALTLGASVAAMPATATGASISMPITITINAPAGMDARALAAMARKEVSEAARQATGRLGALYDQGDGL
jgi:TP901 family phage tail tape measure protein